MKRVLIIGKSSYIGTAWKQYAEAAGGEAEFKIDCVGAAKEEWKQAAFYKYDVVLHMAAIVHQKEKKVGEAIYRAIDYEFPVEVAKRAKANGVKQFLFLSTMAVYGTALEKITADTKEAPSTYYGGYKYMAEEALKRMHTENFLVAIIRSPMVYGKDCKGNFKRLVQLAEYCRIFPTLPNKRSMIYIENLCSYLSLVIQKEACGIGCPQNAQLVATTDLFCTIRKMKNKRTTTISIFNPLLRSMRKRVNSLQKMFGDCYYELEEKRDFLIEIETMEYQKVDFEESIRKSI